MNTTSRFQRALVFQGGGSLGAYEAGVYKATYELLSERDVKLGREGKPLFHIVAGTSIGAMNAAVLFQSLIDMEGKLEVKPKRVLRAGDLALLRYIIT